MGATLDALYYNVMTEIIGKYEQLLTSIEMTITRFQSYFTLAFDSFLYISINLPLETIKQI